MKEMICRLCLQTIGNNNCQPVEKSLLISLKLNVNISKENVMCIECADGLRVFSTFTPGGEDETLPSSDLDNGVKLDPEAIETTSNPKPLIKTEMKCSFCTKAHGREDLISLQESKETRFMVDVLEQYISETNLRGTEELLTCKTCRGPLEGVSSVILKCVEVEERINKYIKIEGTDDKGQVELKKVQQFTFKPVLKSEIESFGINELGDRSDQVQNESTSMAEAGIKCEKEIRNTELIIKTEEDNDSPSEIKTFQCEFCPYQTKWKNGLKSHLLTHNSSSEVEMFQCKFCSYQTKWRSDLRAHLVIHANPSEIKMFQCKSCSYQTKWRSSLRTHLFTHKDPSEIKMFQCKFCSYQTKWRRNLPTHLVAHENPSEIQTFQCEFCSYQTKRKSQLTSHLLTHNSSSEIKMFQCGFCSYQSKWRSGLRSHLFTHEDPSEIKMFKCELCSYEAKRSQDLKSHFLTHKSPSEIEMFKCAMCPYEAKFKSYLRRHLLTHRKRT